MNLNFRERRNKNCNKRARNHKKQQAGALIKTTGEGKK